MAKYKGHDRVVFLDGYVQGWKDGQGVAHAAARMAMEAKPALRYTDAPGVGYMADVSSYVRGPGPRTATETVEIQAIDKAKKGKI